MDEKEKDLVDSSMLDPKLPSAKDLEQHQNFTKILNKIGLP
jgi:hypothetical protein